MWPCSRPCGKSPAMMHRSSGGMGRDRCSLLWLGSAETEDQTWPDQSGVSKSQTVHMNAISTASVISRMILSALVMAGT